MSLRNRAGAGRQRGALAAVGLGIAAALAAAGCGAADPAGPPADEDARATQVSVELRPSAEEAPLMYTLTCGEQPGVEGDHGGRAEDPAAACDALADAKDRLVLLTATASPDEICTEIYGGPQEAHVTGTVEGEPVDARLSRANGCRITDWDALEPLLGFGGV